MPEKKEDIITFKVDRALGERMRAIRNRSEFIRTAVMIALDSVCPLCHGSGVLSQHQIRHWKEFAANHHVTECPDCHEVHLVCDASDGGHDH